MIFKIILWIVLSGTIAIFFKFWLIPKIMFTYYGIKMGQIAKGLEKGELRTKLEETSKGFFQLAKKWWVDHEGAEKIRDQQVAAITQVLELGKSIYEITSVIDSTKDLGKNFSPFILQMIKIKGVSVEERCILFSPEDPNLELIIIGIEGINYIVQIRTNDPNQTINPEWVQPGKQLISEYVEESD